MGLFDWGDNMSQQDQQNLIYALGTAGAGMLKGTNMEWLGAPGAVAANMSKNSQADVANKDLVDLLQGVSSPHVKDITVTKKQDGTTIHKVGSNAVDYTYPNNQMPSYYQQTPATPAAPVTEGTAPVPITAAQTPTTGLPNMLANGGQNFPGAQPWGLRLPH
jgi:hypothetical protein